MKCFLKKILLFLLISSIYLFIGEMGLRISGIQGFVDGYVDRLNIYEFDETTGWETKKDFKVFRSTPYYSHFNYYNPEGFPTDQKNLNIPLDREMPSIALVGDSFVEGYFLPYEFTFPYIIDKKTPDKQVINLGVSGYSPDQYLLRARKYLNQYNVESIVVGFFPTNDVPFVFMEKYQGYAKPYFGESFESPENVPLKKLKGEAPHRNLLQKLVDKSAIGTVLKRFREKVTHRPWTPQFNRKDIDFSPLEMEKALRFIAQIKVEFPVSGKFIVYYIPSYQELLTPDIFLNNLKNYKNITKKFGIDGYSPEDLFLGPDYLKYYIPEDGHLSQEGSGVIAQHLLEILGNDTSSLSARLPRNTGKYN